MKILDLFSGLGGWSAAFKDRGHEVITIDINYRFNPTYVRNIMELADLSQFGKFDVILASPPCEAFSLAASNQHHWKKEGGRYLPADTKASLALHLANHTFDLIRAASPKFWVAENPVGFMRHAIAPPAATLDQCAYGRRFRKPTDLWGELPPSFKPLRCIGAKCSHGRVIKKANGFTASNSIFTAEWISDKLPAASIRAELPYGLSLAMCQAVEKDIEARK